MWGVQRDASACHQSAVILGSVRHSRLLTLKGVRMRGYLFVLAGAGFIVPAVSAGAQDLNTLDRHLEQQSWQRLQDHQNRSRRMPPRKAAVPRQTNKLQACSEAHVPDAAYRQIEAEYRRKVKVEGRRQADQWSQSQADIWYKRLKQQRVCR